MPEAAGIALGLDRLVMIFGDARTIDDGDCFCTGGSIETF